MENYNLGYTFHQGCDIYVGTRYNCISEYGYPSTYTLVDMIHLAKLNQCPIIVKNGSKKWYLKCKNVDDETIIRKINQSKDRGNYPRVSLWHIQL